MLATARAMLDPDRVDLRVGRIEDPLPAGTFDISALAVHHLKGEAKGSAHGRPAPLAGVGRLLGLAELAAPRPCRHGHGRRSPLPGKDKSRVMGEV